MSQEIAVVFTAKSIETLLAEGGSSSWRLDRNHARQCGYVVCTRNAHAEWVEGPEAHHSAFLVGKVLDVVPSSNHEGRWLFTFSEYALIDAPGVWKGDRNPIRYSTLADVGIDPSKLDWKPMPSPANTAATAAQPDAQIPTKDQPMSMMEAKRGLALTFGVAPDAIEITIRG